LDFPKNQSLRDERVARLATHNPKGEIDLVPITFALVDDATIVTAVDHKPKRTTKLQRLENIRSDPRVTILVDHYDHDWSRLWWVRVRGEAAVVDQPDPRLLAPLIEKYEQYQQVAPAGAVIVIAVKDVTTWSAVGDYGTP
jgi:PPOX class probable F420-dependent enzyme